MVKEPQNQDLDPVLENKPEKLVSKTGVRQVKFLMTDDEESTDQRSQETGR